ncbi:Sec-independent protein translocase protein TatB [Belnapia rosea]|uniref:Sec-independent protein translocase protein TatB n=1 Tax=Belnapia rosea TaxID=938405 RepID=A0A1G6L5F3_9PROT|nr:Sec-independent protein translocase protein TatB [Belnapia rosea]SDB70516.1 sec-independent protein translocase protein TatB [Belnapia rosea]SDC38520.1 sec-independent protein translocase protein TatB [Belnapia rosea]
MFDLAWSEIALIGVVALVVIGPKDLPEAIRGVARGIAKLRRMASEFQGQADELVREANLDEVRQSINEIRNFNVRDEFTKAVDKDGSIRKTFTDDPLKPGYTSPSASTTPAAESFGPPAPAGEAAAEAPRPPAAPAFIPPSAVPPAPVASPAAAAAPPPAFVPPAEPPATPPQPTQQS